MDTTPGTKTRPTMLLLLTPTLTYSTTIQRLMLSVSIDLNSLDPCSPRKPYSGNSGTAMFRTEPHKTEECLKE